MCGIAGFVNFDRAPAAEAAVRRMAAAMCERGPDDEGVFAHDNVAIGMRRLSIIDVAGGHQPIFNEDRSIAIVLNGEIYNHVEIRRELEARGHVFSTHSDTEVIVHLYEDFGLQAVQHLNGMFAFAILDTRKNLLWLARDRLGIKPLYVARTPTQFAFASDIRALKALRPLTPRKDALWEFLGMGYAAAPGTFFTGVEKVPAAHGITVNGDRVKMARYWELREFGTWRGEVDDAAEQLRGLLEDSVRLQLRSDVPLGVFLSGGLDSASITALAARALSRPLTTFTIDFAGKQSADVPLARLMAERCRTEHHDFVVTAEDLVQAIDDICPLLDEPILDTALLPTFVLSKYARMRGIKVLLSGAGGDEIFGGYLRHWPARAGSPTWVAESLSAPLRWPIAAVWSMLQPSRALRASDPLLAWSGSICGANYHGLRTAVRERAAYEGLRQNIHREFEAMSGLEARHGRVMGRMRMDLEKYLVEDVLALGDKGTMAASVEGRVPLLDHRLVEFAFSLPTEVSCPASRPKGLLRQALKGLLPSEVLSRGKDGFSAPLVRWLSQGGAFNLQRELVDDPVPPIAEAFDPAGMQGLLRNEKSRRDSAVTFFGLYLFSRWWRAQVGMR